MTTCYALIDVSKLFTSMIGPWTLSLYLLRYKPPYQMLPAKNMKDKDKNGHEKSWKKINLFFSISKEMHMTDGKGEIYQYSRSVFLSIDLIVGWNRCINQLRNVVISNKFEWKGKHTKHVVCSLAKLKFTWCCPGTCPVKIKCMLFFSALTVMESPKAPTTEMSAGVSSWTESQ